MNTENGECLRLKGFVIEQDDVHFSDTISTFKNFIKSLYFSTEALQFLYEIRCNFVW